MGGWLSLSKPLPVLAHRAEGGAPVQVSRKQASVVRCPGGRRVTGQDGTAAQWVLLALWNQWSPEQKFTKLPNVAPREARLQEFFD